MASKKPKSLHERLIEIVNSFGTANFNIGKMRGDLMAIAGDVGSLESGGDLADAKKQIAAMEEENTSLKAENEAFQARLDALLEQLRATEQQEPGRCDKTQEAILQILPLPTRARQGMELAEISTRVGIPEDEALMHLRRLVKDDLVEEMSIYPTRTNEWIRTDLGNEFVIRLRLSGEGAEQPARKYPDLAEFQETLLKIANAMTEPVTTARIFGELNRLNDSASTAKIEYELEKLCDGGMMGAKHGNYGAGTQWFVLNPGLDYLDERNLL
jgi:regulator of replication initiation timing